MDLNLFNLGAIELQREVFNLVGSVNAPTLSAMPCLNTK
ncbi:hypothetical protein P20652_2114 [Pseudoalteromonas sp. BSi20652]|nr:hypothetical protein P20652_2114 [Pseudoalteromonas sp. BSi20652]